jgi:hypothetical protein
MPLSRLLSTFCRTSSHPVAKVDVVMTDATKPDVAANTSPASWTPTCALNCSTSLGRRHHGDISKDVSLTLSASYKHVVNHTVFTINLYSRC